MTRNAFAAASAVMALSLGLAGAAEAATVRIVALTGQEAPGTGGLLFTGFTVPSLSDAGEVAFRAGLSGAGVTDETDSGIFTSSALVAREGDAAPGGGGSVFTNFSGPRLNNAGEVAFRTSLEGAEGDGQAIFSSGTLVARRGDAAPGAGGAVFNSFTPPELSDAGQVVFRAGLSGPGVTGEFDDNAIFINDALVARDGDVAPGAAGAVFADIRGSTLELNDLGETAFSAILGGAGVTEANDLALFATRGGVLDMILREGDLLDLGGGELRPILSLESVFAVVQSGFGFNNHGVLAFLAELGTIAGGGGVVGIGPGAGGTGISGIFVDEADRIPPPAPVPLPPAAALMLAGMPAVGAIGRRRRSSR